MSRIRIIVHGLVQGVGFRYHTCQQALALDLTGYVKNLPDGTVEIVADGPDDQLQQLITWSEQGPSTANVDRIEKEDLMSINSFDTFTVEF
ncbi:MAG: acylphosphatase [Cyanobacteria bacterium J06632_22]